MFLAFVLGGMVAGTVASYAAWLPAFYAFAVPILAPFATRFIWEGNEMSAVMGGLVVIYGVALAVLTHNLNRILRRSVDLQSALSTSEVRFRDLIEGAIEGYMIHRDFKPLFINDAFARIFGYSSSEEVLDLDTLLDLYPPNEQARMKVYLAGRLRGEDVPTEYELEGLRKDDSTIWLNRRVRMVSWMGEPAIQSTVVDITERKRAEVALRESKERHRQFAADVAHELRTPLAVLGSNLDSLEDAEFALSLRGDVDAMTRLVEQLLALARLDILEIGSTDQADLREVCTNVASQLAPLAINNKRSNQVTGCKGPVTIRGNADSLEQAVRNLVENALRYSHNDSTVTLQISDDATISVIDNGPGIAPERRLEIFERFVRADRRSGGSGLGLSIVRRTVNAHNGSVEVVDTPGGGATFSMHFPVADSTHL